MKSISYNYGIFEANVLLEVYVSFFGVPSELSFLVYFDSGFLVQLPPCAVRWLIDIIQLIYFTFGQVRKCKAAFPTETLSWL